MALAFLTFWRPKPLPEFVRISPCNKSLGETTSLGNLKEVLKEPILTSDLRWQCTREGPLGANFEKREAIVPPHC